MHLPACSAESGSAGPSPHRSVTFIILSLTSSVGATAVADAAQQCDAPGGRCLHQDQRTKKKRSANSIRTILFALKMHPGPHGLSGRPAFDSGDRWWWRHNSGKRLHWWCIQGADTLLHTYPDHSVLLWVTLISSVTSLPPTSFLCARCLRT